MARFAQVCLSKMHTLCHELQAELGEDTAGLNLRVGLHSGPGKFLLILDPQAQSRTAPLNISFIPMFRDFDSYGRRPTWSTGQIPVVWGHCKHW